MHDVGGGGHRGQQQQPGLQLAGRMPQLADLVAVQRRPGDVAEHRGAREFGAQLGGEPRSCRNGPCSGGRVAVTGPPSRTSPSAGVQSRDVEHRQRGALGVLEQQPGGVRLDTAGRHVPG